MGLLFLQISFSGNNMRSFLLIALLLLGCSLYASGQKLVTKDQEEELVKVLKRWNSIYKDGIEAQNTMEKRGNQRQRQAQKQKQNQKQSMTNNNAVHIHLNTLQQQHSEYHGYPYQNSRPTHGGYNGRPQYQYQAQAQAHGGYYPQQPAHRYPSPHGHRGGSSKSSRSSRKR